MEHLILRQWKDSDLEPYAAMNADPDVMRHFPAPLTKEETAASLECLRRAIEERGWGLWAVEVDGVFAGFTGLNTPSFSAHFTPCTEIGWRFRREFWGRGLAYRAARTITAGAGLTQKLDPWVFGLRGVSVANPDPHERRHPNPQRHRTRRRQSRQGVADAGL